MAVTKKTLSVVAGDSKTYSLVFTENNIALDINGWIIYFTVKDHNGTTIISKTVTSHTTPASGLTQIDLTSTDTDIEVGVYNYEIRTKTDTNSIFTVIVGSFSVEKSLTEL